MLKLKLVLVVATLFVSCIGKPSADIALQNEDVTTFRDVTHRSTLSEDTKPFEGDSSINPVGDTANAAEIRNATTDTLISPVVDRRTENEDMVTKVADETYSSRTANTKAVNGENNVSLEKTRTNENGTEVEKRKENADVTGQKRKIYATKLDNYIEIGQTENNTRRLVIGFSMENDKDTYITTELYIQSLNDKTRRSNDGAPVESVLHVDESLPTQTGNFEKNSTTLLKTNQRSGTEKSEVNVDISSRSRRVDGVQKNVLNDDIHDATASSETRSAKLTTIELETKPLQSAEDNQTAVPVEKFERSGVAENIDLEASQSNARINGDDRIRSAARSDTELDTNVTAKSGNESVVQAVTETLTNESISGKELEETNSEDRSGKESAANTGCSSDKALELTPELKTGQKPEIVEIIEETGSNETSNNMITEDNNKGDVDIAAAVSEVAKEAASRAGSPADQLRIEDTPSHTPLHFPTTIPVPMRRSISQPSIIITRIPDNDIITLPHDLGFAASSLVPNNLSRRGVDFIIGLNASENGFTFDGEDRTDSAKSTDQSTNVENHSPESILRVDDYSNDFNKTNLEAHVGSPVADTDLRQDKKTMASHLSNVTPGSEHSRRAGDALNSVYETYGNIAEETSNEETRSTVGAPMRNDANSYPLSVQPNNVFPISEPFEETLLEKQTNLYPITQPQTNHYTGTFEESSPRRYLSDVDLYPMSRNPTKPSPESFVARYPSYTPQAESFLPSVNHYLPAVEASLKSDSAWPKTLVNRLIQASSRVNQRRYPQQNQFGILYPYHLYYPSSRRY